MPSNRLIKNAFNAGEISNEMLGRMQVDSYANAVERCRNFIPLPHGSARLRPGTDFVNEVKHSTLSTRLIPFNFSETQTFIIEMGQGYFRFHLNGGTLMNGSVPYQLVHPYDEVHLPFIKYEGNGNIITFTHPSFPPAELRRISNLNWTYTPISFQPNIASPAAPIVTRHYPIPGVPTTEYYVITAISSEGYEESQISPSGSAINDLTIIGNYNTIAWSPVPGAVRYNVYKYSSGAYGHIGQTIDYIFTDDNILPDVTKTIPIFEPTFIGVNNYPSAVGYFQQRRFFAGSNNLPTNIWATQTGSDANMGYSIPNKATDALRFRIVGKASQVRHIASLQDLMFMTASTEWRATSTTGGLSSESLDIKSQSQNGVSHIKPVPINDKLMYEQAQGGHIRQMAFKWESQNYTSNDVSLLASHLFNNKTIKDMAYSRSPYPILWAVSSDGKLLSMTYDDQEEVLAWASHDSNGDKFESCAVITEGTEDSLYVIVNRNINGVQKRYIERLHVYKADTLADAFHVDCGLTYFGAMATTISGLDHLEGRTVSILADGAVMPKRVVTGGSITLPDAASKIHIGLPYRGVIKTLPTYFTDTSLGQGRVKNINKIFVRVKESGELKAGPNETDLTPIKVRKFEPYGSPPSLATGEIELAVLQEYNQEGYIYLVQDNPLPTMILYIAYEVMVGG